MDLLDLRNTVADAIEKEIPGLSVYGKGCGGDFCDIAFDLEGVSCEIGLRALGPTPTGDEGDS